MDRKYKQVRSDLAEVILVCRKCSRKLDGGFGKDGRRSLAKALRREFRRTSGKAKGRRARFTVVEADCFDICPKNAAIAINAARPGAWKVVPRGAPAKEVLVNLGVRPVEPAGPAPAAVAPEAPRG